MPLYCYADFCILFQTSANPIFPSFHRMRTYSNRKQKTKHHSRAFADTAFGEQGDAYESLPAVGTKSFSKDPSAVVQRERDLVGYTHIGTKKQRSFHIEESEDEEGPRTELRLSHLLKMSKVIEEAQARVANAIAKVSAIKGDMNPCHTRFAMMLCFGAEDTSYDSIILEKLQLIQTGLEVDGLRLKDVTRKEKEEGVLGLVNCFTPPFRSPFMPSLPKPTPLQISLPFFGKTSLTSQIVKIAMDMDHVLSVRTLVHEVSHQYAGTGDQRYGDPGAVEMAQMQHEMGIQVQILPQYQNGVGVWNADSYGYFVYKINM